MKKEEQYFLSMKAKKNDVICAFIVFNNYQSKKKCMKDYYMSRTAFVQGFLPNHLRFRDGKVAIRVRQAPDPTDIVWKNLGTSNALHLQMALVSFL